ncbi:hypothetical protein HZS_977 [Henneguya salminicola]|nr:hypothetical protein HZS_977 [Henneguya salminicola]
MYFKLTPRCNESLEINNNRSDLSQNFILTDDDSKVGKIENTIPDEDVYLDQNDTTISPISSSSKTVLHLDVIKNHQVDLQSNHPIRIIIFLFYMPLKQIFQNSKRWLIFYDNRMIL